MRFLKSLLDLTRRDKQRNVDVRGKLIQDNIADEIRNYEQYWLEHVNRVGKNRLPKIALLYQLEGKGGICRPRRKWREQDYLIATGLSITGRIAVNLPRS